jgi:KDO2-lipid IV(A) lauroyltransferase
MDNLHGHGQATFFSPPYHFTSFRYRIEYLLFLIVVAVVRAMPLDIATALSARVWQFFAIRGRRHKRALANLKLAYPESTQSERNEIACKMWCNLGRIMAETMQLDRLLLRPDCITLRNPELLERYRGKNGSSIFVSLHMGNWELGGWPLVQAGINPAGIYRVVTNPYVDRYLRNIRDQLLPAGQFAKGGADGYRAGHATARRLVNFIRNGGRLCLLCDLYDPSGIPVPFFTHPARSTPMPAMLARRVGARIWIARCLRVGTNSKFEIEIKELKVPRTSHRSDDIRQITMAMQAQFELWIKEQPEQWMWSNRRWS